MRKEAEKQNQAPGQKKEIRVIIPSHFKVAEYREKKEDIEKDNKIQILFNKALSREKRAQLIQEIDKFSCVRLYQGQFQVLEHPKELIEEPEVKLEIQDNANNKLNQDREIFQEKYEKYNSEICDWLKLDKNLSISVIERESGFDEKEKSDTGADSLMQLTNDPFDDMKITKKGRGMLYAPYFKDLPDTIISQIENKKIQGHLIRLKKDLNNKDLDKNKTKVSLNKAVDYLSLPTNRKNPELNLLIGDIYLSSLRNDATDEKINIEIKKLSKVSVKRFKFLLKEKGINLEKENEAELLLKDLQKKLENKNNIELRKDFYALSRYNGDNTPDKGVAHKITYAAVVSVAKDLRDNNKIV